MTIELPDQDYLVELRKQYPNIYTCEVGGHSFVFRALRLDEITEIDINPDLSSVDKEDLYVEKAILYPDVMPHLKAGYVTQLSNHIENVSCIGGIDFILSSFNEERISMQNDIVNMFKIFILAAMPNYTEEELNKLTIRQLIRKTVLAENILTLKQSVNGIEGEGVTLQITEATPEEAAPDKQRQKPPADVTTDDLLKRIRYEDKIGADAQTLVTNNQYNALRNLDPELLDKAARGAEDDYEDPIARKLRESMG